MNVLLSLVLASGIASGIFGEGIIGSSANTVILVNSTGLKIVRVVIADRTYEDLTTKADKVMVTVTPKRHNMEVVFRGGAHIDWPKFNFSDVRQITFELVGNRVSALTK